MFDIISSLVVIALIYLFFSNHRLKSRVDDIQRQLRQLSGGAVAPDAQDTDAPKVKTTDTTDTADTSEPVASASADVGPWVSVKPKSEGVKDGSDTPEIPDETAKKPPTSFVFNTENRQKAVAWLMQNWFLAVAALSLALAGVFLVQYGVENGVLSPFWRVMGAVALGVALIGAGEFVRRKWGDGEGAHTAYLPSTFSGAGLVALFAAVLSARQLYGLIGPEMAFVDLVIVSLIAVALGWYYGPWLAMVGVIGSVAAPFLVGGESDAAHMFYYYFALVAVTALLIDAIKRWAWVSALALILTYGAAWFIYSQGAGDQHFLAFALIASAAAIALPRLSIWPSHIGLTAIEGLTRRVRLSKSTFPAGEAVEFPTRVAFGAFVASGVFALLVALKDAGQAEVWLAIATLCVLFLMVTIWGRNAPALRDLAAVAPVLFVAVIAMQALDFGSLLQAFDAALEREPETAPPMIVSALVGISLFGSAILHWRGLDMDRWRLIWSGGAALFAPLVLVTLEFWWVPAPVLGDARWAAHGIIIAALMVFFASQAARRDGEDKARVAFYALAALTMISFALVIMLSTTALTLAIAVTVLGAAVIDRRLNLPLLGIFVQVGVVVIGWRLVFEPGIDWAQRAPLWEVLLAYLGSVAMMGAAWVLLATRGRHGVRLTVESGVWAGLGVLISVLLNRAMGSSFESHYGFSLFASVWIILMLVQIYRMQAGGRLMRWIRIALAVIYGLGAMFIFVIMLVFANPLESYNELVVGPPVFDSLLVAFGIPALILFIGVWKLPHLNRFLRIVFIGVASLFAIAYVALEIRRLWRGVDLTVPGVIGAEQYSYTIAMLVASVALLFIAFSRRSVPLRQIATVGIALTIAKVFLVDMAELTGLLRVASFLGLGLSLAGLGWVYRQMSDQWERVTPEGTPDVEPEGDPEDDPEQEPDK